MADRKPKPRIPIWVRVPVIVALVLVGIIVSSMLLGATDIGRSPGGGHGSGGGVEMTDHGRSPAGPGEGHGGNEDAEMPDHTGARVGGSGEEHDGGDGTGDPG